VRLGWRFSAALLGDGVVGSMTIAIVVVG